MMNKVKEVLAKVKHILIMCDKVDNWFWIYMHMQWVVFKVARYWLLWIYNMPHLIQT
jgi:hypothetical protein